MIFVVPVLTAVTTPDEAFTVATEALLLLHEPPASPLLLYVAVEPIQSGDVPLTVPAFTFGLTVNILKLLTGLLQPALTV